MPHYRHLLFDLDNTLWNFTENARSALHEVYVHYQLHKYYPDFEAYFFQFEEYNTILWQLYGTGKITKEFLCTERFLFPLRKFGVLNELLAKEMSDYYLHQCCLQTVVMPHTFETLDYLRPRYEMHVISNGFTEVQYRKLDTSGLSGYFNKIFLSEEIGYHKPNPEFFAHIFTVIDATKEECLVIGDNFGADIEGAMNVGIDQVFYTPQSTPASRQPTYTIHDLSELRSFL